MLGHDLWNLQSTLGFTSRFGVGLLPRDDDATDSKSASWAMLLSFMRRTKSRAVFWIQPLTATLLKKASK